MAIINHSSVMTGLIQMIRLVVGYRLATLPSPPGSEELLSAVIRDRAKGPRPDFPYIVVDRQTSAKTGGAWLRDQYVNSSGKVTYKTEQTLNFTITCIGSDADDILNELRISLIDDINRIQMLTLTGAVFQDCTEATEKPTFIETDFVDGSEMDIYFTAVSEWSPVDSSIIETVTGKGEYMEADKLTVTKQIIVNENYPIGD